jgi:hypothetical protein
MHYSRKRRKHQVSSLRVYSLATDFLDLENDLTLNLFKKGLDVRRETYCCASFLYFQYLILRVIKTNDTIGKLPITVGYTSAWTGPHSKY